MSESTKGGNVILEQVRVPAGGVEPDQPFEVEADVSNGATHVMPWDKDRCRKPGTSGSDAIGGYTLEVVFEVDGETRVAGPVCHRKVAFGKRTNTYSKTFTAPSGDQWIDAEVHVRLPGSGKETKEMSKTISVDSEDAEEADSAADDDNDNSDDGNGDDGNDDNGGSNPLAGIFPFLFPDGGGGGGLNALVGVLVLLAIAWMLDSGSDIAG